MTSTQARIEQAALVRYNGDHSRAYRGLRWSNLSWACNWGFRDHPVDYCWAVDRWSVADIVKDHKDRYPCEMWTRESRLPLPASWQHRPIPGIDSGSAAVKHALDITEGPVVIIGADGVCGGSRTTVYDYPWHRHSRQKETIHRRHAQTLRLLDQQHPGRIILVWDQPVEGFTTLAYQEFDKYWHD